MRLYSCHEDKNEHKKKDRCLQQSFCSCSAAHRNAKVGEKKAGAHPGRPNRHAASPVKFSSMRFRRFLYSSPLQPSLINHVRIVNLSFSNLRSFEVMRLLVMANRHSFSMNWV